MTHRCTYTIRRYRLALDEPDRDDPPVMDIACEGPDGCGSTASATGVIKILELRRWLANKEATS